MSTTRRRILAVVLGVATMIPTVGASPANAILFVGACELHVTFHFKSGPVGLLTAPTYDIEVTGINPTGAGPCQTTEQAFSVVRGTGVWAPGQSSIWSCGAVLSSGNWYQTWHDSNGEPTPPPVEGRHRVFGTWDNWTIEAEGWNPVNFTSAIELRLDPSWAAQATSDCASGNLWTLRTIGVQVFQDVQV